MRTLIGAIIFFINALEKRHYSLSPLEAALQYLDSSATTPPKISEGYLSDIALENK